MTMPFPAPTISASGQTEVLVRYLDYFRETVVSKVSALSDDELRRSRLPSGWTPLELLKHLRYVELRWIEWRFQGHEVEEPWGDQRGDRWYVAPEETRDLLCVALNVLKGHTPQPWLQIPISQRWGHRVQGGMARLRRHWNECCSISCRSMPVISGTWT